MPLPLMPLPPLQIPLPAMLAAPARRDTGGVTGPGAERPIVTKKAREREPGEFAQTLREARKTADRRERAERMPAPKPNREAREDADNLSTLEETEAAAREARVDDPDYAADAGKATSENPATDATPQPDGTVADGEGPVASQCDQQTAGARSSISGTSPASGSVATGVVESGSAIDEGALGTSASTFSQESGASSTSNTTDRGSGLVAGSSASNATPASIAGPAITVGQKLGSSTPAATPPFAAQFSDTATNASSLPRDQIARSIESVQPHHAADGAAATSSPSTGGDRAASAQAQTLGSAAAEAPAAPAPTEIDHAAGRRGTSALLDDAATLPPLPAVSRAAQVDLAVRFENAGGQTGGLDAPALQLGPAAQASSHGASGNGFAQAGFGDATTLFDRAGIAEDEAFAPQIVRGLHAMMNQRGGAMTMRLDPPELGELRVQMTIARGVVTAEFHAGTQQAQTLLDKHMATLRHSLESQGLTVERLSVHASATQHGQQQSMARDDSGSSQQQSNSSWSNQHDAAGSESRGRREQDAQAQERFAWEGAPFSLEALLGTDAGSTALAVGSLDAERRGAAMTGGFAR